MTIISKLFRGSYSSTFLNQMRYRKPHKPWKNYEEQKGFRRNLWLMNGGILMSVFAACYMIVPFYKVFCETTGLVGDNMKKDYSKVAKEGLKVHMHRKYSIIFKGETEPELDWSFEPVQDNVTVHAGEPALMFYKTYNKTEKPLVGIALYSVFPEDAGYYFSKIQCFCFNQQVLNGKEELDMPLYFYLEPEIDSDPLLYNTKEITIVYKFYLAKNQDLAKWMENQQKWEFEQKSFIRQKRIEKLKQDGKEASSMQNDEEIEKLALLSSNPDYVLGEAKPTDITQLKHA